jgi:outer membrane protein assembly factor BamB
MKACPRLGRLVAALVLSAGVLLATGIQAASAATAGITLKPTSGPPTTKVTVSGSGFGTSDGVVVNFATTKVASTTTSSTGTFSVAFSVPKTESPGTYTVTATDQTTSTVATAKFLVRTNYPQFHFNVDHTGLNPYENVINTSNVSKLTRAWTDTTSSTVGNSPAVVNGVAYVAGDNGLHAYNASSGRELWAAPGIFFDQSSPAVANGQVYAASVDGNFYAFATKISSAHCSGTPVTCTPLWTSPIDGAGSGAQSSPTVSGGFVYVSAGYNFYAFKASGCSAATCHPLWTAAVSPSNGESPVSGASSPAVVGGQVIVGGYEGIYAYSADGSNGCSGSPKTCQPLWYGSTVQGASGNNVNSSSATVSGGKVFIGAGNSLFAFSTSCSGTCSPLWSFPTSNEVDSTPAVANGTVYFDSDDHKMYALSTSGALKWSFDTGFADSSSPLVANGVVYTGSYHNVYALNAGGCGAATCTELWSASLTDSGFASPVVANGMLYQGEVTNGEYLVAFKLP